MKSLLKSTLVFLFIVLGFTACEGPQGPPGEDGWSYIDVKYYTISRWALAADGTYFFAEVSNSAITDYVFDKGVVVGYLVQDYNKANELHIPLPYEMFYNEYDVYGNLVQWSETVSFDIMPGSIGFYYKPSDFYTGLTPPSLTFKIVAMW